MMTTDNNLKAKIQALLNTAANAASTDGEVHNAMRFAKSLMDKHHLSEEDLASEPESQRQHAENAEKGRYFVPITTKRYYWEERLGSFVCELVGGVNVYYANAKIIARHPTNGACLLNSKDEPYKAKSVVFYGIAEDAMIASEMYHTLRQLNIVLGRFKFGGCYKGDGGKYCEGFVNGLFAGIRETEPAKLGVNVDASSSRQLTLVARRKDLIDYKCQLATQYLENTLGVHLGSGSRRSGASGSSGAFGQGRADGQTIQPTVDRTKKLE